MCIAILKPKGMKLKLDDLEECWENNPHGAGLMFADNGKLVVRKGWMKWRNFQRAWMKHDLTDKTVVLHFRISTGGNIDQANCHPHLINADIGVVHNGIFSAKNIPIIDDNYSDTCHFVRTLRDLGDLDFLGDAEVREWIRRVSVGSKLIFMRSDGSYEIVNSGAGEWNNGSWFSNTTYKYPMFYQSSYEEWDRSPVTGKWGTETQGAIEEIKCSLCDFPIYLSTERACDICEACVTAMYNDIRAESEQVYSLDCPQEQEYEADQEAVSASHPDNKEAVAKVLGVEYKEDLQERESAKVKRIHEQSVESEYELKCETWYDEQAKRLKEQRVNAKKISHKDSPVGMQGY